MVEGKFRAEPLPEGQNRMPIEIQVTDAVEKVIFSREDISTTQQSFAFTTSLPGDYIVCFHNQGIAEFMTQRRVHFSMVHGIDARDYSQAFSLPWSMHGKAFQLSSNFQPLSPSVSFSLQSWCTGRHEHSQMISVLIENTAGDENGTPDKPAS